MAEAPKLQFSAILDMSHGFINEETFPTDILLGMRLDIIDQLQSVGEWQHAHETGRLALGRVNAELQFGRGVDLEALESLFADPEAFAAQTGQVHEI